MSEPFCIKHVNKTFKNETVVLNNTGYIDCTFKECRIYLIDEPKDTIILLGCDFKNCELIGDGWNYGFVETWHECVPNNKPINWQGPIGNRHVTKH